MTASPSRNETLIKETDDRHLDPLTGTLTRQAFFQRLIGRTSTANTSGRTFAVCLISADQFRNVNHKYGLETGDAALIQVALRVRLDLTVQLGNEREFDLCRYDGTAFALLIPDSSLTEAAETAESFRRAVRGTELQRDLRVTVSAGVAQYRLGESAEDALSRAEQALQLAKQFGRDRVEIAESPDSHPDPADVIPFDCSA